MTELKSLPVNLLKLDMSFVRGITTRRLRPGDRRVDHPPRPGARPAGRRRGHRVAPTHRQAARARLPPGPGLPHLAARRRRWSSPRCFEAGAVPAALLRPDDRPALEPGGPPAVSASTSTTDAAEAVAVPERTEAPGATLNDISPAHDPEAPFEGPIYEPWLFRRCSSTLDRASSGSASIYSAPREARRAPTTSPTSSSCSTTGCLGTQMFRLGAAPIGIEIASKYRGDPGVYCEPDIVPAEECDAVRTASASSR